MAQALARKSGTCDIRTLILTRLPMENQKVPAIANRMLVAVALPNCRSCQNNQGHDGGHEEPVEHGYVHRSCFDLQANRRPGEAPDQYCQTIMSRDWHASDSCR